MESERWQRIKQIFAQVQTADPDRRNHLLEQLCGQDGDMRREIEQLLACEETQDQAFLESPPGDLRLPFAMPKRVGPYRVIALLGQGGMGCVFEAVREDEFQQKVAVKLMHFGLDTPALRKRFQHERQIMATLNHPNVARLLDGGTTTDGLPYFVLEFIEGQTITDFCRATRANLRQRIDLFLQVCEGVGYAHRNFIVHRDIKPANVLVSREATVKLLDFGIAKLLGPEMAEFAQKTLVRTRTGQAMMTPQYASPEQYLNQPITTATDVYGLGLLLYELVTGTAAYDFSDKSMMEIDRMIVHDLPTAPSTALSRAGTRRSADALLAERIRSHAANCGATPQKLSDVLRGELDHIIMKALRKEPERRYPTVEALTQDLHAYLEGRPVSAHGDSLWYRSRKFVRRNARAVTLFASFVIMLTSFAIISLHFAVITRRQSEAIAQERDRAEEVTDFLIDVFASADPFVESSGSISVAELLQRNAGRIDAEFENRPFLRARLLTLMGQVYTALGDGAQGQDFLERALHLATADAGFPIRDHAEILSLMGENLRIQGKWNEARACFRRALNSIDGFNVSDVDRAEIIFKDASNELADRQFDAALAAFDSAESLLDPASPDTTALKAKILNGKARAFQEMNAFDRAEDVQRRAIALARRAFGTHHAHTGDMLANLAIVLDARGHPDEARQVFDEALHMLHDIFGERHPLMATLYNNLGMMLENQGRLDEAIAAHQRALDIRRQIFGEDNVYVIMSLINLGYTYDSQAAYPKAEAMYRQAIDIAGRVLDPQHPDLGFLYNNFCYNLQAQERWDEAQEACDQALRIYRAAPGHEIAAGQTAALLGKILLRGGRPEQAIEVLEEALRVADEMNGDAFIQVGRVLNNLGLAHARCRSWREAEAAYRRAVQVNLEEKGSDHSDTLNSQAGLEAVQRHEQPPANR